MQMLAVEGRAVKGKTDSDHAVILITDRQLAMRLAEALSRTDVSQLPIEF